MRLARLSIPVVALATVLVAGCGSGGSEGSEATTREQATTAAPAGASARSCTGVQAGIEGLRVTGVDCGAGRAIAAAWSGDATCASPASRSRFACSVRGYRCLGANGERGIAVSCARPGRSVAFVAKRG
jgi:hypothetical protein